MFGFNLPFFPNGSVENSFALKFSIFDVLESFFFNLDSLSFLNTLSSNSSICFFTKSTALLKFSFALERTPFILFPYCEFYSRGGFNTRRPRQRSASGLLILVIFSPTRLEVLDPIQIPCRSVRFSQACIRLCSIYVP